jgi:hypothetical protein
MCVCVCVCVCVDGWVGGWRENCVWICKNPKQQETPNQSAAAGIPKRAKANLRAWGSAAPPHKCVHRRFFILPPPLLRPLYHWISAANQPQQHTTYKSKSFRDVLSLFLCLSVSLPNRKMSVSGPTNHWLWRTKKNNSRKNNKDNNKVARSQERLLPRHKRRSRKRRRPTCATSAVRWWIPEPILMFPASGMYLIHTYLPTYLPTYRCLEFVPFGIF